MPTNDLLETIRVARAADATPDARQAGATACRQILAGLEPTATQRKLDVAAIASVAKTLRGVPPDQLLDIAIAKLRSALPPDTELPTTKHRFRIVAIPGAST
jgi:hypothetical protein